MAGKSLVEATTLVKNQPNILRAEIRISPFWLKNIPKDTNRIKVLYPLVD
jgi:hypothetical protein